MIQRFELNELSRTQAFEHLRGPLNSLLVKFRSTSGNFTRLRYVNRSGVLYRKLVGAGFETVTPESMWEEIRALDLKLKTPRGLNSYYLEIRSPEEK